MVSVRTALARRLMAALDASPSRIPVLVGACGSGRSTAVRQLRDRIGRTLAQYIDVERTATTPERFLHAITVASPFPPGPVPTRGTRAGFDAALAFLNRAHAASGAPVTFILDEFLELRTFESFPGLRRVLSELLDSLAASSNRFVLTSRYTARTLRALQDRPARFEVIQMPPLTVDETLDLLDAARPPHAPEADYVARTIHALADGRPAYTRAMAEGLVAMGAHDVAGGGDPVGTLSALLARDGALARLCHFSYELRLHRARGYGALKAILEILAEQEGLTLTTIAQRLQRTPGSTKDYLSWLEDVDLITAHQKRYSFTDPLLRVWVRLHCQAVAPTEDDVAREVHRYALPRLPQGEPALALAGKSSPVEDDKKAWGIIEID